LSPTTGYETQITGQRHLHQREVGNPSGRSSPNERRKRGSSGGRPNGIRGKMVCHSKRMEKRMGKEKEKRKGKEERRQTKGRWS
jgi:hypothetical protein